MRDGDLTHRTTRGEPLAQLECAFIDEFLHRRGHTLATIGTLPGTDAHDLLKAASSYASGRLAELEARAHYVRDLHDATESVLAAAHQKGRSRSSE